MHGWKSMLRWRTALVLRELEEELASLHRFGNRQAELYRMMVAKAKPEQEQTQVRLCAQREKRGAVLLQNFKVEWANLQERYQLWMKPSCFWPEKGRQCLIHIGVFSPGRATIKAILPVSWKIMQTSICPGYSISSTRLPSVTSLPPGVVFPMAEEL